MRSTTTNGVRIRALLAAAFLLLAIPAIAEDMDAALEAFDDEDYDEAHRLIRPLAEDGHAVAQFYLASMYYDGRGVPQDHELEAMWIRRSADQGFGWAQNMLGRMHMSGRGVDEDIIAAHFWFSLAAGKGTPTARQARDRIQGVMTEDEIAESARRIRAWEPVE